MYGFRLIEQIKVMFFRPRLNFVPIMTLVLCEEVGLRDTIVIDPVKSYQRNVCFAH